jgi:hypothetical protein
MSNLDITSADALIEAIRERGPYDVAREVSNLLRHNSLQRATEQEYLNWLNVVDKLRVRGIEINDDDDLADALNDWGDAMGHLRLHQIPSALSGL